MFYIDPAGVRTLLRDYAEQWPASQVHRPSTATQLETYLRLHAYPTLGRRPIGAVRRSEVQAWVKGRTADLGLLSTYPTDLEVRRGSRMPIGHWETGRSAAGGANCAQPAPQRTRPTWRPSRPGHSGRGTN